MSDRDAIEEHFRRLVEAMVSGDLAKTAELMDSPPDGVTSGYGTGRMLPGGSIQIDESLNLHAASGKDLDKWAEAYGVPRDRGETDVSLRKKILHKCYGGC